MKYILPKYTEGEDKMRDFEMGIFLTQTDLNIKGKTMGMGKAIKKHLTLENGICNFRWLNH